MSSDYRIIATKRLQVSPNTETYQEIYTVSPGKRLRLTKIEVFFPSGTLSELQVRILQGWVGIAPTDGVLVGDNVKYEIEVDETYGSQSKVKAYLKNTNATSSRECVITLIGQES